MRSSSGKHFLALDHLRALAAFLVFAWHFIHSGNGTSVTLEGAPVFFPFALIDEGHTGVALFMVLSGYLFAKLLDGKDILYRSFFWNRFIRLTPLLIVVFILVWLQGRINDPSFSHYVIRLCKGLIYPEWPNGGWSITTEIHFYILLPLLLWLSKHSRLLPLAVVVSSLAFRFIYFQSYGEVQSLAYWTIIGRIDQFVLGIVAFLYASELRKRKHLLYATIFSFACFWWWFDKIGGFYLLPKYPSLHPVWIWIPTIEGIAYSALILLYDTVKINEKSIWSRILQRLGEYSYSIYLLHFFIIFRASEYINRKVMDISNFYVALAWAVLLFAVMIIPGYLSFRFIEAPFLKLRRNYIKPPRESADINVERLEFEKPKG